MGQQHELKNVGIVRLTTLWSCQETDVWEKRSRPEVTHLPRALTGPEQTLPLLPPSATSICVGLHLLYLAGGTHH